MKGVKYSLIFNEPDNTTTNYNDLSMTETINKINELLLASYGIPVGVIKITKHIIYNMISNNKNRTYNKFLMDKIKVIKN